jgi:telomere length regulation protein
MNSQILLRPSISKDTKETEAKYIRGAAAFFKLLASAHQSVPQLFVEVLTSPDRTGVFCSTVLLRSVYAAISTNDEEMQNVLDRSFEKFADELFIKHAPIIQQESNAQVLLLSAGHAKRSSPLLLRGHARSSQYLNAISKHLSSNSTRVRWLGMVIGTAISALVDKIEARMNFGDETLDSVEARWYLNLTSLHEEPAKSVDLHALFRIQSEHNTPQSKSTNLVLLPKTKQSSKTPRSIKRKSEVSTSLRIIELASDDEDNDLVPYAKPDSDQEDDEEDPTLINRDKPRPPVYIRDLLTGLRDSENYDRHRIALITAASLIRRKSGFGKEVSDHSEELASVLMNLNDQFEMDDFADMRHEALVAIILADPQNIPEFMAASLFDSDYSLQQRTSILTALGLGAREVAGYRNEESNDAPSFPSKQLPIHLHKIYSDTPRQLTSVSSSLEQSIIEPLALEAADKITGPNALKVRTFSSRMEVEKKKKKPVPNSLSKIVADKFFFPLTGRWWITKASNPHTPFLSGHLLPTYLRTLAIILHASGPFSLSLPQMTAEMWDLLLAVRSSSLSNKEYGVLEALLFAFLMLLEVNENKEGLARDHARQIVETQEWARMVLEVIRSGDEGERIRALAASVIARCHEVIEKWQRLMIGDMIDD